MVQEWSLIIFIFIQWMTTTSTEEFSLVDINFLNTKQLAAKYGYGIEEHLLESPDGYILMLHRLMPRANGNASRPDRVVLLHHGMLSSSEIWMIDQPNRTLAFILSDLGYDVWLVNARGTYYSMRHKTLTPQDSAFWNFSWHEMGYLDLPMVVEYVKSITGVPSVFYVGHSLGSTAFFVMLARRPEMAKSIRLASLLAPVAYLTFTSPWIKLCLIYLPTLLKWFEENNVNQILPRKVSTIILMDVVCGPNSPLLDSCFFFFSFFNAIFHNISKNRLGTVLSHLTAGSSLKTALHYLDCYLSDDFNYYDYGINENKIRYGQSTPPRYNLSLVEAPVALYYSSNDHYLPLDKIDRLEKELPNIRRSYLVPDPKFTHDDFVMADNAKDIVFISVIELMENS